jgi:hypothetical protein
MRFLFNEVIDPQCTADAPGPAPGLFLLSRKASTTNPIDIHDNSMYTSW